MAFWVAPLCYLSQDPQDIYGIAVMLFCRHWSRLLSFLPARHPASLPCLAATFHLLVHVRAPPALAPPPPLPSRLTCLFNLLSSRALSDSAHRPGMTCVFAMPCCCPTPTCLASTSFPTCRLDICQSLLYLWIWQHEISMATSCCCC